MVEYLQANQILATKRTKAPRFYSASGYGGAIPTDRMIKLTDKRWRRVYVACYSNSGTAYVRTKACKFLVLSPDAESRFD